MVYVTYLKHHSIKRHSIKHHPTNVSKLESTIPTPPTHNPLILSITDYPHLAHSVEITKITKNPEDPSSLDTKPTQDSTVAETDATDDSSASVIDLQVLNLRIRFRLLVRLHCSQFTSDSAVTTVLLSNEPTKSPSNRNGITIEYKSSQENINNSKRTRQKLSLDDKIAIIEYWKENNENMSIVEIGRHFDLPRTTIHGVIKKRQTLEDISIHQPRDNPVPLAFRVVERKFFILEELLHTWVIDLEAKGILVSNKKMTTQAFDIHRMLTGLLSNPLPPCLFTSGWLKGFKKRRLLGHSFDSEEKQSSITQQPPPSTNLFDQKDIYVCDTTIRNNDKLFEADGYSGIMVDPSSEEATKPSMENWLDNFNSSLENNILLSLDKALWDLLELDQNQSKWNHITFIQLKDSSTGPSGNGIMKEFKAAYHTLLIDDMMEKEPSTGIENYLNLLSRAWMYVHKSTIKSCLGKLIKSETPVGEEQQQSQVENLGQKLKDFRPVVPHTVVQYYLVQDKDTGPSGLLREKISQLQRACEFEACFNTKCSGDHSGQHSG
ncbi:hypothetical protein BGZ76_010529 [Entomortierella beljakovae]|nr:hypothetical protein BGZ76_010529 [Entomortierella beljakovae]